MREKHKAFLTLVILAGFCCTSSAFGQFGQTNSNPDERLIIRQDQYTYKVPVVQDATTDTFVIEQDKKSGGKKKTPTGQIVPKLFRSNSIIAIHYFPFDNYRITSREVQKFIQSIPSAARQYDVEDYRTGWCIRFGQRNRLFFQLKFLKIS